MGLFSSIGAALGPIAPIIGAGVGLLGGSKDKTTTAETSSMPEWTPQQMPYVFGSQGWNPQMPQLNAEALNYGTALTGGYNPQYGPQGPMGFEQLLSGILGMGGGQLPMQPYQGGGGGGGAINMGPMLPQPHPGGGVNTGPMLPQGAPQGAPDTPWFMDPNAFTQGYGARQGGIQGLLGYGQGVPPPLMTNNPYFSGQGVRNPENLMQGPGMYDPALAAQEQQEQQAPPNGLLQRANDSPAMPAPSTYRPPAYMQPDAYGKPAWARDMVL